MVTNLGVKLDEYFKLDAQVNEVVKSGCFQLRLLSMIKPFVPFSAFERVVHTFIMTFLDYCNSLYVGIILTLTLTLDSLSRLQLVQNAAVHPLTGPHKRNHICPVLVSLHWLPVQMRIHFKILLFVCKALHGLAPISIVDLLKPYSWSRALMSSDQSPPLIPKS